MNKTILLIEDNEQNRYLATFLLEKHGYSVLPASDGMSGIELGLRFPAEGYPSGHPVAGAGRLCGGASAAAQRLAGWCAHHRGNVVCDGRRS